MVILSYNKVLIYRYAPTALLTKMYGRMISDCLRTMQLLTI